MKKLFYLLILLVGFQIFGCSRKIYEVAYPTLLDGKYDSEFPYKSSSKDLMAITETVRKLNSIAYYQSYIFNESMRVRVSDIRNDTYKYKAYKEIYFNNSVIGTATVIHSQPRRIVLLTCAHVIDFPDTIITYYQNESGGKSVYIQSVAFKKRQSNFVADLPERGELEVLAMDTGLDIALLGKTFEQRQEQEIPSFNHPFGRAGQLEWGSFVYLVGYPKGYEMITKGIVSQPNRDKNGGFLVDAMFNRGFSGGIVLAIRDGVPNFELVGMASSVAADYEYYLAPSEEVTKTGYDPRVPYTNEMFIQSKKSINYGITFIISSESIVDFFKTNENQISARGYDLTSLY